jgi:hypothetical protein
MKIIAALALVGLSAGCGSSSSNCKPGEVGCACVQQGCNGDLICVGNTCTGGNIVGLAVDSNARGCEVLLTEDSGKVDHLDFGDGVTGRWLRQGDKVAAAFVSDRDQPIGAVQVDYAGSFSIASSHCYGSQGELLQGSTVHR